MKNINEMSYDEMTIEIATKLFQWEQRDGWWKIEETEIVRIDDWCPLIQIEDTEQVINFLINQGWGFRINKEKDGPFECEVFVRQGNKCAGTSCEDSDLLVAICKTAIASAR